MRVATGSCRRGFTLLGCALAIALGLSTAEPAYAGCGCEKAPPDATSVRPNATYGGGSVSFFDAGIGSGQSYTVTFNPAAGGSEVVQGTGVWRRDLADGVYKAQLIVTLPSMPLGPVAVTVSNAGGTVLSLPDSALTVVPQPVAIPAAVGTYPQQNYQAAVGRDGTVYVSLDVTAITQPRVVSAQALGYALRFTHNDVAFYNPQGFLMQLLGNDMPGLYSVDATNATTDSDVLQYSRHEFNTYFLQHFERSVHGVDPNDPNWHDDGTRHIEHNHLVLAIAGTLEGGGTPAAGATPAFDLELETATLFDNGAVGTELVDMRGTTGTDSYNSASSGGAGDGDALSNGQIAMFNDTVIDGDATAFSFDLSGTSQITGTTTVTSTATDFLLPSTPTGMTNLGDLSLANSENVTLGPGSYLYSSITLLNSSSLTIDNATGPVTIYVTGDVALKGQSTITTTSSDPEKFAFYVQGPRNFQVLNHGIFTGLVYAPESLVELRGGAEIYGAVVAAELRLRNSAKVHFDTALRGQ